MKNKINPFGFKAPIDEYTGGNESVSDKKVNENNALANVYIFKLGYFFEFVEKDLTSRTRFPVICVRLSKNNYSIKNNC